MIRKMTLITYLSSAKLTDHKVCVMCRIYEKVSLVYKDENKTHKNKEKRHIQTLIILIFVHCEILNALTAPTHRFTIRSQRTSVVCINRRICYAVLPAIDETKLVFVCVDGLSMVAVRLILWKAIHRILQSCARRF